MIIKPVCFVAGKSGGHIVPCLTLAQTDEYKNKKVMFFSCNTSIDMEILSRSAIVAWHLILPLSSIHITSLFAPFKIGFHFLFSFLISFYYLCRYKPSCIVTTGGVVAIPVCYAGFLLRIPITIYCLDAVPGKAIQAIAPISSSILVCFVQAQSFFSQKTQCVPYPIRYLHEDTKRSKSNALKKLGLHKYKTTIAILGGSQGSLFLSECVKLISAHPLFSAEMIQFIHQTGFSDTIDWYQWYNQHSINVHIFSYQAELLDIYVAADIIICRAGAGTLCEIAFFKKKCIMVPLITDTTDHQVANAQAMAMQYPYLCHYLDQLSIEKNPEVLWDTLAALLFTRSNHYEFRSQDIMHK